MKKTSKIAALLLVVAMVISLAACGGGSASNTGSSQSTGSDAGAAVDDTVYELTLTSHDPEQSICGQYLKDWAAAVTEASGGRLQFTVYLGGTLASATEALEAIRNGTADLGWGSVNLYPGVFPISDFISVPENGNTASRIGSLAHWNMYEAIPEMQEEYSDYHMITIFSGVVAPLATTKKKIETAADLKGVKVRVPGKIAGFWAEEVGLTPMTVATPETYENLEKGVIDGCMNDWHNIDAQKLTDLTKYIMDYTIPGSPFFFLMNKDSYDKLPADLQQILDDHSGAYAAEMGGIYWDSSRAWTVDRADELGVEIYTPSAELAAHLGAPKEKVYQQYIEYLDSFGLDGKALFDQCMEIMAQSAAEYPDPWANPPLTEDFKK